MGSQTQSADISAAPSSTTLIKWVLDTRPLWPEAKQTKDLSSAAARALALLRPEERSGVLRYYHVRDAKLALGSALLKRLAIVRCAHVPWSAAVPSRDPRTHKPVFRVPGSGSGDAGLAPEGGDGGAGPSEGGREDGYVEPLLFNVSHQAGLVVLLALAAPPSRATAIGVDIVCPSERRDRDRTTVSRDGWSQYVAMHEDVFSPEEAARLRALVSTLPPRDSNGRDRTDALLAHFYALWCLREGYVKMTGDALLAPWLRDLDMRNVAPPPLPPSPAGGDGTGAAITAERARQIRGETGPGLDIWLHGERVRDADVRLEWLLGDEYMVCTAVRWGRHGEVEAEGEGTDAAPQGAAEMMASPFVRLDMEDVLAEAEAAGGLA
ncbi:phosphopantetheinyl transferase [Purpureocillium lavendulum]|uniref:holo-[acyl-carrier-protein] synthase n=1 Tax=Purpureocillium lavendulum TaxID=1247861 RepID=A0AB34FX17_9HYPO|nr:phosphopantetheinyl transferase [Purpureocillium lavendulum]